VQKLNYLMVTKLNIIFAVSVMSQFLLAPKTTHLEAVIRILKYLKKAPKRAFLFRTWTHQSNRILRCRLGRVHF